VTAAGAEKGTVKGNGFNKLSRKQRLDALLEEDDAPETPQKAPRHEDSGVAGGFGSDADDRGLHL